MPTRIRHWPALASMRAVAALACAGLACCACTAVAKNASIGGHPATPELASMSVCAHSHDVDRLSINRVNRLPQNHERFSFPARITVTGAHRSQAVAQALCALPMFPSGLMLCPADFGISYVLSFTAGASKLSPVTVEATGCQEAMGLGPARWIALSPAFWTVLARTAGISPANHATFTGAIAS